MIVEVLRPQAMLDVLLQSVRIGLLTINREYLRRLDNKEWLLHVYAFTKMPLALFALDLYQFVF